MTAPVHPLSNVCCWTCQNAAEKALFAGDQTGYLELIGSRRMILCPTCGNKRCPKATDHALACTGSNEPGQPGSLWESDKRG